MSDPRRFQAHRQEQDPTPAYATVVGVLITLIVFVGIVVAVAVLEGKG